MSKAQQKASLECFPREKSGTGAARAVRREGKVPAIIYSKKSEPVQIALRENDLVIEYRRGRFNARILELKLDGKTIKTLPQALQFHPVSDKIEHVDFLRVEDGDTIRVSVPVIFRGREKALGIKRGGVLNIVRRDIELFCKPDSIPERIEISVEKMDIGESIHIEDIELPEGVEPTVKRNFTIATIAGRGKALEEPKAEEAAGAEGDAKEGDAKEGDKKEEAKKEDKK